LALAEAYSCGVPVIASNLGAMAEIVEDGVTGLLFEAGNSADLRIKVDWMKSHPSERNRMGNNARRVFEEKYTPERNYKKLISIYQDVLKG
jgi:glycosyltransferase involved in cell wall biosynthesis